MTRFIQNVKENVLRAMAARGSFASKKDGGIEDSPEDGCSIRARGGIMVLPINDALLSKNTVRELLDKGSVSGEVSIREMAIFGLNITYSDRLEMLHNSYRTAKFRIAGGKLYLHYAPRGMLVYPAKDNYVDGRILLRGLLLLDSWNIAGLNRVVNDKLIVDFNGSVPEFSSLSARMTLKSIALITEDPQDKYDIGNTRIKRVVTGLKVLNNLDTEIKDGVRTRLKNGYRHWPVAKSGKKGFRLISSPGRELRPKTDILHERLRLFDPGTDSFLPDYCVDGCAEVPAVLSYTEGIDYVALLSKLNLSSETYGEWVVQIDYSDYFTRISPEVITNLLNKRSFTPVTPPASIQPDLLKERFGYTPGHSAGWHPTHWEAECIDMFYLMAETTEWDLRRVRRSLSERGSITNSTVDHLHRGLSILMSQMLTTVLPLWKAALAGKDILGETGEDDPRGYDKFRAAVKTGFIPPNVRIYELHRDVSYRPWAVRGVPQGAAYSGIVANWVAEDLARHVVTEINGVAESFGGAVTRVILYSDNIYVFMNAPTGCQDILRRELPDVVNGVFGVNFLKPSKIIVADRKKKDVKILGLIIDSNGKVRLSRRLKRQINQRLIHAGKGITRIDRHDLGRINWYKRVRTLAGEVPYSRALINEKAAI